MHPSQPAPAAAPRRRIHPASIVLAVAGGLALLGSVFVLIAAAAVATVPAPAVDASTAPAPTVAQAPAVVAEPTVAPTTEAPPAPSSDIVGDGVLLVGSDIKPGRYRANVPTDSYNCYWARLRGTSGGFNDIIANGNGDPGSRMTVTIARTDKAFETNGCGTWRKV